jgi:phosphoenolpyruvate carboxylase
MAGLFDKMERAERVLDKVVESQFGLAVMRAKQQTLALAQQARSGDQGARHNLQAQIAALGPVETLRLARGIDVELSVFRTLGDQRRIERLTQENGGGQNDRSNSLGAMVRKLKETLKIEQVKEIFKMLLLRPVFTRHPNDVMSPQEKPLREELRDNPQLLSPGKEKGLLPLFTKWLLTPSYRDVKPTVEDERRESIQAEGRAGGDPPGHAGNARCRPPSGLARRGFARADYRRRHLDQHRQRSSSRRDFG